MKIMHVITGLDNGGAEKILFNLCVNDRNSQHIVVSLGSFGKYGKALSKRGIEVVPLGWRRSRLSPSDLISLFRLIRKHRPQLIQTWMPHSNLIGGIVGRLAGVKRIFWGVHSLHYNRGETKWQTRLVVALTVATSRVVPFRIICCSYSAKETHQKLGYPSTKLLVISNGFEVGPERPVKPATSTPTQEFGLSSGTPVIIMVARFDPQKDHETLLSAASVLESRKEPFQLLLVGPEINAQNSTLSDCIQMLKLESQVSLLGPRDDVPELLRNARVHVLSSKSEAFGNVIVEAMLEEIPSVVTDIGDMPRIVGDTGWVVESGNPVALADALQTALQEDQNQRLLRGRSARARAIEYFSVNRMVDNYLDTYRQTDSGKGPKNNQTD